MTNTEAKNEMNTLEEFDRAISSLLDLEKHLKEVDRKKTNGVNVFYAVGMQTQEIKHSAFLAWLFNPINQHGLKNEFLRVFLEMLFAHRNLPEDLKKVPELKLNREILNTFSHVSSIETLEDFLRAEDISVLTERPVSMNGRIDIFLESISTKTLIAIENKVFTGTHDNQLERYEKEFEKRKDWKRIFVFLTPLGDLPEDDGDYRENWCVISYETVLDIIKRFVKKIKSRKLKYIMEDYIEMVNTEILKKKKELLSLCRKIRREHADALKILDEYTDQSDKIIAACKKFLLEKFGNEITFLGNTTTGNLDFYTSRVERYFDVHDGGFKQNGSFKFLYQIRKGGGYKYCWFINKVDTSWSEKQRALAQNNSKSLNRKQDGENVEKSSFCNLCNRKRFLDENDLWVEFNELIQAKIITGLTDFVREISIFESKYFV